MNLVDLEAFIRVVEHGTITAAASVMGLPKSTVSRRISRLEDALGVALLTRASRSVGLTETGRQLHARCAPALRELDDAEAAIRDAADAPRGLLRLTALPDMGSTRAFTELILRFREAYPQVRVELQLTERVIDLVMEGVDLAVRTMSGAAPSDGLVMRRLGALRCELYASPDWLATLDPHLQHPAELAERCPLVVHRVFMARGPVALSHRSTGEHYDLVTPEPGLVTNDFNQVLAALMAGAGVGLVPTFDAAPWLESGALVRVLPEWAGAIGELALVWPESRHMAPRVRAFIDYLSAALSSHTP